MGVEIALPAVGLFGCFSAASNSGSLTAMAALEAVKRLGGATVGVCSLPAILSQVHRQSGLVRNIGKLVVMDGCRNACAKNLLAGVGIAPGAYLNLENDLGIVKKGPFTSLEFTDREVQAVCEALVRIITEEASVAGTPDQDARH
jgi:uncharacterized metal-binding protein